MLLCTKHCKNDFLNEKFQVIRNQYTLILVSYIFYAALSLDLKSCPTLCNPMDCRPPGSSDHGISQARILEWTDISFSRGSSLFRNEIQASCTGSQILHHWSRHGSPWKCNSDLQFPCDGLEREEFKEKQ